jgi:hypothetical protein
VCCGRHIREAEAPQQSCASVGEAGTATAEMDVVVTIEGDAGESPRSSNMEFQARDAAFASSTPPIRRWGAKGREGTA